MSIPKMIFNTKESIRNTDTIYTYMLSSIQIEILLQKLCNENNDQKRKQQIAFIYYRLQYQKKNND